LTAGRVAENSTRWDHEQRNYGRRNLSSCVEYTNVTVHKITFYLAGQTGDSFALTSAHKD